MTVQVAVIVGSLRKASLNRKLAEALTALAPEGLTFEFVATGDLPLYDPDLDEGTPPAQWARFRDTIRSKDAVLFVTPEYNRSVPASLKNALDVGSRPMQDSVWPGKPAGIVTGSPGGIGGFGANHHLRQSLVFLNMPAMAQPEAYIGGLMQLFNEDGSLASDSTRDFLKSYMAAFADWIAKHNG